MIELEKPYEAMGPNETVHAYVMCKVTQNAINLNCVWYAVNGNWVFPSFYIQNQTF